MPRRARQHGESALYHVILRGINRQNIFEDESDYQKFIDILEIVKDLSAFKLYAYCLMSNHVHLLIKIVEEPLEQTLKRIGIRYAGWFNYKYVRSGHLFQDRFKSEVVADERYLLTLIRYIHQNPVKAGMCKEAKVYQWTSYIDYLNGGGITDRADVLSMISESEQEGIMKFRELVDEPVAEPCMDIDLERRRFSDIEVREKMKALCGAENISVFQKLEKKEQRDAIIKMRRDGIPLRQIARVTGSSRGVVEKMRS